MRPATPPARRPRRESRAAPRRRRCTPCSRVGQQSSAHRVARAARRRPPRSRPCTSSATIAISRARSTERASIRTRPPAAGSSAAAGGSAARASASTARCRRSRVASAGCSERRAERQHVGAVVLARVARERRRRAHRGADAAHLVGGDRRAQAGAVDDDAGVGLAARHGARHRRRRCPDSPPGPAVSVPQVGHRLALLAQVVDRAPPSARRRCGRDPIATRVHGGDRRQVRRQRRHRPCPAGTTVTRRARSVSHASGVTWPPFSSSTVEPGSICRASASLMKREPADRHSRRSLDARRCTADCGTARRSRARSPTTNRSSIVKPMYSTGTSTFRRDGLLSRHAVRSDARLARAQNLLQVRQRQPGVDDVLDDDDVAAFEAAIEILESAGLRRTTACRRRSSTRR